MAIKARPRYMRLRAVCATVVRVVLVSQVQALPLLQGQIFKWVASSLQPWPRRGIEVQEPFKPEPSCTTVFSHL